MRLLKILSGSFTIALLELGKNKLRSFLSLFGVTIGIFCIISVLATVNSLERNIQNELKSFGTNTIYIDKWEYSASGPDYPFWKYVKRPTPNYTEVNEIKRRTVSAKYVAFKIDANANVQFGKYVLKNIRMYGISEDFARIQPLDIAYGRFINETEFLQGMNRVVVGYNVAEALFGTARTALNKPILVRGRQCIITGVAKKQGKQLLGGWDFDQSMIMPYKFARTMIDEKRGNPLIMVQGKDNINSKILKDDLVGSMRSLRKLRPAEADDFSLNDINDFSDIVRKTFKSINIGGWSIGALAFIVGIFGVANIMFVTVKERTSQIGIKKAVGAKSSLILTEFLLESALLCIIGGLAGLFLVFILTQIITRVMDFQVYLSIPIIALALFISIAAGIIAGIIPAIRAAKMDPVRAIRSN